MYRYTGVDNYALSVGYMWCFEILLLFGLLFGIVWIWHSKQISWRQVVAVLTLLAVGTALFVNCSLWLYHAYHAM
jgi:hypothetical protein